MTIPEAIDYLTALWESGGITVNEAMALGMAIKSLEAWEKVKKEIDEATEMLPDGDFYIKNFDVKRIIDKYYFSEVEE